LSDTGSLLFEPGGSVGTDRRLVTVNAGHEVMPFVPDARAFEAFLSTSRDGKQVAVVVPNPRGTYEIWIAAADRTGLRRLISFPGADAVQPVWSPDGQWVAFNRNGRDKDDGVYVLRADGSGEPRAIFTRASSEEESRVVDWAHDGSAVIVARLKGGTEQLLVVPVAANTTTQPKALLTSKSVTSLGRVSPDGHYLVFVSNDSGSTELHLAELSGDTIVGQPAVITSGGGAYARWSADSKRLYYLKAPARLMSVTVEGTPTLHVSAPAFVQDMTALRLNPTTWDVLPDGRILGIQLGSGEDDTTSYNVVLNWLASVKGKLPK
jgi:Tol biopolymer transport system component